MDDKSTQQIVFDAHTEQLLQKIKDENITIDPTVWELLTHILGNKVNAINYVLGDLLDNPKWILNCGSYLMIFLFKVTGRKGALHTIPYYIQKALNNSDLIKEFVNRLRRAIGQERKL